MNSNSGNREQRRKAAKGSKKKVEQPSTNDQKVERPPTKSKSLLGSVVGSAADAFGSIGSAISDAFGGKKEKK